MKRIFFSLIVGLSVCSGMELSDQGRLSAIAIAQQNDNSSQKLTVSGRTQPIRNGSIRDAEDGRPPGLSRVGGGGRNPCLSTPIALTPGEDTVTIQDDACIAVSPTDIAITSILTPTIWVYVPSYTNTETATLTLIKERRALSQWDISLPKSSGVMCFQLPYAMETGQLYEWRFSINLTESPAENPKVGGLIQHTTQDGNYWTDQLTSLGLQRMATPSEPALAEQWEQVLVQQGLGDLSQVTLQNSCFSLSDS